MKASFIASILISVAVVQSEQPLDDKDTGDKNTHDASPPSPPPSTAGPSKKPKHIIYVLADDIGFTSVGYNRELYKIPPGLSFDVLTPNMDRLAKAGVILNRHYVYETCTGTRQAVQSGRFPTHTIGRANESYPNGKPKPVIMGENYPGWPGQMNAFDQQGVLPVNMTGIAHLMKAAGYQTHLVGKWDIGIGTFDHTPHKRGYDTAVSYNCHANDYWTGENWRYSGEYACKVDGKTFSPTDLWKGNDTYNGPAVDEFDEWQKGNLYEEEVFKELLLKRIDDMGDEDQSFLMYTPHIGHTPTQVPEEHMVEYNKKIRENPLFSDLINDDDDDACKEGSVEFPIYGWDNSTGKPMPKNPKTFECRNLYNGMVNYLDGVLGEIESKLREKNMWDDTLIVFSSDNGGVIVADASGGASTNFPLRGGKGTSWEGGVRAAAFISGGFMERNKIEGKTPSWPDTYNEAVSIADWYTTLANMVGVEAVPDNRAANADPPMPPVDGIDQWENILNNKPQEDRVISLNGHVVMKGDYKFLKNIYGTNFIIGWIGAPSVNPAETGLSKSQTFLAGINCTTGCLFNVKEDYTETYNLYNDTRFEKKFKEMSDLLDELSNDFWVYPPDTDSFVQMDACQEGDPGYNPQNFKSWPEDKNGPVVPSADIVLPEFAFGWQPKFYTVPGVQCGCVAAQRIYAQNLTTVAGQTPTMFTGPWATITAMPFTNDSIKKLPSFFASGSITHGVSALLVACIYLF